VYICGMTYDALSRNADVAREHLLNSDRREYSLVRVGYATERGISIRTMNLPLVGALMSIGSVTDFGTVVSVEKLGVK